MNSPYIDLSNSIYFRDWTDVIVYPEGSIPDPTDKAFCTCACSNYKILKSSIRTHVKTTKHKAFVRLIKI